MAKLMPATHFGLGNGSTMPMVVAGPSTSPSRMASSPIPVEDAIGYYASHLHILMLLRLVPIRFLPESASQDAIMIRVHGLRLDVDRTHEDYGLH